MHSLLAHVRTSLADLGYAHRAASLVAACSLGPDSMALTLALIELQTWLGLKLHGVYIDHGLRAESELEGQMFFAWAKKHCLSAEVIKIQVPHEPSKQAAARRLRYEALLGVAKRVNAQAIATGHTLNDQSETFLMRLLGGAGLKGLAGMPNARTLWTRGDQHIQIIRPLLDCSREEVVSFLQERNAVPVEDPSNQNKKYLRSRIRHRVLPVLREEYPDFDVHIGDLTKQLREDAEYLDQVAEKAWASLQASDSQQTIDSGQDPSRLSLEIRPLLELPKAIFVRVLRLASPVPLSAKQTQALFLLCQIREGSAQLSLSQNWQVERIYERLVFQKTSLSTQKQQAEDGMQRRQRRHRQNHQVEEEQLILQEEGTYTFQRYRVTISKGYPPSLLPTKMSHSAALPTPATLPTQSKEKSSLMLLQQPEGLLAQPWEAVFPGLSPLILRKVRPGDRIKLPKVAGHKKLSDLFVDAKIPRSMRDQLLVVCNHLGEILWVVGLRFALKEEGSNPQESDWHLSIKLT